MDEQPLLPDVPTKSARSNLLTVLCILTFIGSGMNGFSSLFIAVFYDTFMVVAEEIIKKLNLPGMEILLTASPGFFLATGVLYAGSISGAVLMFRQRKAGFHIYTIAQILLLIAPMYFMNLPTPSAYELLFSGLFVILYSTQLKLLR